MERREFLAGSSGATALALAAASGLTPAYAQNAPGWNKAAFDSKSLADVAKALGATSASQRLSAKRYAGRWIKPRYRDRRRPMTRRSLRRYVPLR